MKVSPLFAAALLLCLALPGADQAKPKPKPKKFCVGRDGKSYKIGKGYLDTKACIQYTCEKKGKGAKMTTKKMPKPCGSTGKPPAPTKPAATTPISQSGPPTKQPATPKSPSATPPPQPGPTTRTQSPPASTSSPQSGPTLEALEKNMTALQESMQNILEMMIKIQSISNIHEINIMTHQDAINLNREAIETNEDGISANKNTAKHLGACMADVASEDCPTSLEGKVSVTDAIMENKEEIEAHVNCSGGISSPSSTPSPTAPITEGEINYCYSLGKNSSDVQCKQGYKISFDGLCCLASPSTLQNAINSLVPSDFYCHSIKNSTVIQCPSDFDLCHHKYCCPKSCPSTEEEAESSVMTSEFSISCTECREDCAKGAPYNTKLCPRLAWPVSSICWILAKHFSKPACDALCTKICTTTMAQTTADPGSGNCLTSPGYPNQYPSNSKQNQTFSVAAGQTIEITFQDFNIESSGYFTNNYWTTHPANPTCPYDYLQFWDGNGNTVGPKLCGNMPPYKMTIQTSTASALFHSDGNVNYKGFKFCYTSGCPESDTDYSGTTLKFIQIVWSWQNCASRCSDEEGCSHWKWHSPSQHIDSRGWYFCYLLSSYDGKTYSRGQISGKSTCLESPQNTTTSPAPTSGTPEPPSGCPESDTDYSGTLLKFIQIVWSWKNCARHCSDEEGCSHWKWHSPSQHIDSRGHYFCYLLSSYDGKTYSHGKISGKSTCLESTQDTNTSPAPTSGTPDPPSGNCLTSPGYPNHYPSNSDTNQTFSVAAGQTIGITFQDFNIESSGSITNNYWTTHPAKPTCPYDYLQFWDGNGNTVGLKLCGNFLPDKITIETSTASALFHSDGNVNHKGFKFCYTSVSIQENSTTSTTTSLTPGTPATPDPNSDCPEREVFYSGTIIKTMERVRGWRECAKHCSEEDGCSYWTWEKDTWEKDTWETDTELCRLLSTYTGNRFQHDTYSGKSTCVE